MTLVEERPTTAVRRDEPTEAPVATWRLLSLVVGLLGLGVVVAAAHVVQGTADVGVRDLVSWLLGRSDSGTAAVVIDSRLPRLAAGALVGVALGVAGCVMQSMSRNLLASPDTLAVNAGAFVALAAAGGLGLGATLFGDLGLAFAGGLLGAALVLGLAGTEYGTVRLVLAGTVVALVLRSVATTFLILNPLETRGLHAWEAGSLSQNSFDTVVAMVPVVLVATAALGLMVRRLDVLSLGDDEARALGVPVRQTQLIVLLLAVLLSAAAVTVAGPIAFVGLVAPGLTRLAVGRVPGLHRHRVLLPVTALVGINITLAADVVVRAMIGSQRAVMVPTGIMTSLLGGLLMIGFAFRLRAQRLGTRSDDLDVRGRGTTHPYLLIAGLTLVLAALTATALLVGDATFLLGDLVQWLSGRSDGLVAAVLDARAPRVVAAILAGVALAVAGTMTQAVTRNALADPAIIGVSGGAAVGAVVVVTAVPTASFWVLAGAAGAGALLAATLVFGLAARGGFATDRLVLVGVGVAFLATALVTLMIVTTDPYNASKALTWLSGSTYGRSFEHLVPLAVACAALIPAAVLGHRHLDLVSIDDDTPRVLGVRLPLARLGLLACAVLLTATSVAAIGLVTFVGLVTPHAARTLVGRRHALVIPVAALLGASLMVVADLVGRTVMAPTQLPVSLLTALIGGPYFFFLLRRAARS